MKQTTVTLIYNGVSHAVAPGCLLSQAIHGELPCGGHGKCGKCRVVARGALSPVSEAEQRWLTPAELEAGVRLACMTYVTGDCTVVSADGGESLILTEGTAAEVSLAPTFSAYGAAVDIGTTTLAAKLFDRTGRCLAVQSCLNPQSAFGADVVSRIEAALRGEAAKLAGVIRGEISRMLAGLADEAGIPAADIDRVVITGNTVMLCLLTETDVEPLSHAPFALARRFGESLTAGELALSALMPETAVYLPPCMAAFVGADTTCALLAAGICRETDPALLVDIGTNGEMALSAENRLLVCSTAAGPAFEGVGISMGMRGETGAVDRVTLVNGRLEAHVIGGGEAKGICGSGLVDAVACLLATEELDETGFLEEGDAVVAGEVALTQQDIRAVQLAKSAISAGIISLLSAAGVPAEALSRTAIAGGFGSYLDLQNAAQIGLLPKDVVVRASAVGNAALAGAVMLLLDEACTAECAALAARAEHLSLAVDPVFTEAYMTGMLF